MYPEKGGRTPLHVRSRMKTSLDHDTSGGKLGQHPAQATLLCPARIHLALTTIDNNQIRKYTAICHDFSCVPKLHDPHVEEVIQCKPHVSTHSMWMLQANNGKVKLWCI
jgi:hypothetical protein